LEGRRGAAHEGHEGREVFLAENLPTARCGKKGRKEGSLLADNVFASRPAQRSEGGAASAQGAEPPPQAERELPFLESRFPRVGKNFVNFVISSERQRTGGEKKTVIQSFRDAVRP